MPKGLFEVWGIENIVNSE